MGLPGSTLYLSRATSETDAIARVRKEYPNAQIHSVKKAGYRGGYYVTIRRKQGKHGEWVDNV